MKTKYIALVMCLLLIVALLTGCGERHNDIANIVTVESNPDRCETTSTTHTSQTKQTSAKSTSKTASTGTTVQPTVVAPTVNSLTPLKVSSYYGFSLLQQMPNADKLTNLYQKMVETTERCVDSITLDATLTEEEILKVFYYYRADYPQHFWLSGEMQYALSLHNHKVTEITLAYTMTGDALKQAQTEFHNAVVGFLETVSVGADEYERELLLHDALITKITYEDGVNAHNAYGALVEGKAVCDGYARAFQYLLYQAGIQCLIAEGESENPFTEQLEGHAWNVVCIDGQYYQVDLTWDDTNNKEIPVAYSYFNVTTAQIKEDHVFRAKDCYSLPLCTAVAANYHVKNGTRLTAYTVESVAGLLKGKTGAVHLYCVDDAQTFAEWYHAHHKAIARAMGIVHGYSYKLLCVGNEVVVSLTF